MRPTRALVVGLLAAGMACGRGGRPADTTLSKDLSLAAQQHAPYDSLSPSERSATSATAHSKSTPSGATRQTSSGTRTASGTSGTSGGGTVEKHTGRDAAIGAAAGAVIGATASRNKVKGGLIGAAVGGIVGGVIGNNVDKKKVP